MKTRILVALLAIATLTLVACAPSAPPAPAVKDTIGVVNIGPNDPIHVAWMLVVTGADGTLGVDSRRGIEIAIDDKGSKLLGDRKSVV